MSPNKPTQTKRRKYPCVVVKKSEWNKMPKKTRAAMIEMCQTAADQVGSVQRRKLAKAIIKIVNNYYMFNELGWEVNDPKIYDRVETLLKKHGL